LLDAPPSRGMTKERPGTAQAFCIRHCERSEAIHRYGGAMDCFVAPLLAMTVKERNNLLRRVGGFQRRIIRVSLGTAAIERRLVGCVERRAALEAFDQIGIGDEQFSERDQVGLA
jgi:hypothetical protein